MALPALSTGYRSSRISPNLPKSVRSVASSTDQGKSPNQTLPSSTFWEASSAASPAAIFAPLGFPSGFFLVPSSFATPFSLASFAAAASAFAFATLAFLAACFVASLAAALSTASFALADFVIASSCGFLASSSESSNSRASVSSPSEASMISASSRAAAVRLAAASSSSAASASRAASSASAASAAARAAACPAPPSVSELLLFLCFLPPTSSTMGASAVSPTLSLAREAFAASFSTNFEKSPPSSAPPFAVDFTLFVVFCGTTSTPGGRSPISDLLLLLRL
mmetsp:Transcript_111053/g.358237  ORF Transcript_111053/g.358237 Transcript_111053/m.358237 type:complete len:283 (-) Transcript_111053:110-958(-)